MSMDELCLKCSCGNIVIRLSSKILVRRNQQQQQDDNLSSVAPAVPSAVDCHCPHCRRYHVAAFVSYLQVCRNDIQILPGAESSLQTYPHSCDQVGPVERWFCRQCYSKVATRIVKNNNPKGDTVDQHHDIILLNMGTLDDSGIPEICNNQWKTDREPWCLSSKACWTDARPQWTNDGQLQPPLATQTTSRKAMVVVKGGCVCGACQYEIMDTLEPTEMQHCYCQLCRRLSGSPFMTWVPVRNDKMKWNINPRTRMVSTWPNSPPLLLMRTTEHGQRHVCRRCGGVLTIVYDDQPDITWPAMGGFDDGSLPPTTAEMNRWLHRVLHICCIWKQPWYQLPKDGLPRIDYAS